MSTELTSSRNIRYRVPHAPLNELKDRAIILTLASEYLCKEPFLKKNGFIIEKNVEVLKGHVEDLKDKFVGKPAGEISLNEHLEPISQIAGLLQKADEDTREKCLDGKLGKELAVRVKKLAVEIGRLKERLEGEGVSYTSVDSVLGILGRLRFIVTAIIATTRFGFKLVGFLFLVCIAVFSYLFITMESEGSLLEKIEQSRANIRSAQASFSRASGEINDIQKRIADIEDYESNRLDKIEIMSLNLKVYKLTEEQQKTQIAMDIEEKALEKNLKKIEEMKRKTFFQRLLRK